MTIINGTILNDVLRDASFDLYSVLNANWSAGEDHMYGGINNDVYHVNSEGDRVFESPQQGIDTVVSRALIYALPPNVENVVLDEAAPKLGFWFTGGIGNAGNNVMVCNSGGNSLSGEAGSDRLVGNVGQDWLGGGEGNDTLFGNAGDDWLEGGEGHDTLIGGDDQDTVSGGAGNDLLQGGHGDDRLYDQLGMDTLFGNDGEDFLFGGENNDRLDGGNGDDHLEGSTGNDTLLGGAGRDVFIFAQAGAPDADTISDFSVDDDTIALGDALDAALPGAIDPGVLGLVFVGGDAPRNLLSDTSFFKGDGFTGSLAGAPSGIYVNTADGHIWYNPTPSVGNDTLLIGAVVPTAAAGLTASDFQYSD